MSASDALAYYALPLAVGILGTLLAMGVFGRKLPGDRSNEVDELQMLLAHRDQELENLESAAATTLARMQDAKTEIERISLQYERLAAEHAVAEKMLAELGSQSATFKADYAAAEITRRKHALDLQRRDADVAALSARLNEALDELAATRQGKAKSS
ncbi:MAG: hypothetical protein NTZ50_07520 [Chloroflexi bacterium]|nr:hypothetical protein [Chloroflexota bacterium]